MHALRSHRTVALSFAVVVLSACSGGGQMPVTPRDRYPVGTSVVQPRTIDEAGSSACSVSTGGFVSYTLPQGQIAPIDFDHVTCASATTLDAEKAPQIPTWAAAPTTTQAIFVATSLQEVYAMNGMTLIEADAARSGIPVTWMIGNSQYLGALGIAAYNGDHSANGDDVELEDNTGLYGLAEGGLPWYAPAVSVEGAGHERNIAGLTNLGNSAFWGITWNSHGTDNTSDEGAPWGTFCADPASYKRPAPDGSCALVSFEWTARDLTRAYFQNTNSSGYSAEAAFSTDPDDVLLRGGFDEASAESYERQLIDAYAAAGVTQPIVVMSQQETIDEANHGPADDPVLGAIYDESRRSGMTAMTLRSANAVAHAFSARPRAIAFPYIPGGNAASFDGAAFTPATIDYHDMEAGMTFVAGRTLPDRIFTYANEPTSTFDLPLPQLDPGQAAYPTLLGVTASGGMLAFTFSAPAAMHFGVAVWADPSKLGVAGAGVTPAGHAGYVAAFDLPAGRSTQLVPCGCSTTTLPYSS